MRPLTDYEKRSIRRATIGIAIYLILFCGFKLWQYLHHQRTEYVQLVTDAKDLKLKVEKYKERAEVVKKMMEDYHLDPAKLTKETIVGEASSAIQKAAMSSGVAVGTIRESSSRGTGDEIASVQFEGSGQVMGVTGFLDRMRTLGFPLVIDTVQITAGPQPGMMKLSLTIVILNYEKWQNPEATHA